MIQKQNNKKKKAKITGEKTITGKQKIQKLKRKTYDT